MRQLFLRSMEPTEFRSVAKNNNSSAEELALDHVSDPRGAAKPALIPSSLWGAAMPPTFFAVLFCRLEIFQRTTKSK
jgi:hypothetical protein